MSRQATATVDYFPHIVNVKIIYVLESKFGNDGYAAWFKIQELIGSTDGHYIDCRDLATWEFLTAKCMVNEEKLTKIIQTLSNVGAIDGEMWEQKVIFCQSFINNVADVYKRRTVTMPTKETVIEATGLILKDNCRHIAASSGENVNNMSTDSDNSGEDVSRNPQSKVKESRVEETTTTPLPPDPADEEKTGKEEKGEFEVVVDLLSKNICMVSNQVEADLIRDWIETMPRDWITEAVKSAALSKARSIRYVDTILQAWVSKYRLDEKPWELESLKKSSRGRSMSFMEKAEVLMRDGDDDG